MPAHNFYIALYDPQTDLVSFPYFIDEFARQSMPIKITTGLTGEVLRTGKPLIVSRTMESRKRTVGDAVVIEGVTEVPYVEFGPPAAVWLGVPLRFQGRPMGVMAVQDYHDEQAYGEEEKQILSFVADQVALAIERKRAAQALREREARLRESEARFSSAFRASPVYMSIARMSDGHFIEASDSFLHWLGCRREDLLGKTSLELGLWTSPDQRTAFWNELKCCGNFRNREYVLRNRQGAYHTMLLSAETIEINGQPHILTTGQDITERKKAENELYRALAREKELHELKNSFVSMVSHEFRTPLGIIQSSAEILNDYFLQLEPTERQEHLGSISKNTRRMAALMEEVLVLGRFDAGKMHFQPTPLALGRFCERLIEEVKQATENACPIELKGLLVEETYTDERLLRHILTNLLTNAVKYSEPGTVVTFQVVREGEEVLFTVRDQGIGISEADQQWLFNAFYRGHNVGTRPGTGLGLVIVKRCVELHGGRIDFTSQEGHGTTVTVRLPLRRVRVEP